MKHATIIVAVVFLPLALQPETLWATPIVDQQYDAVADGSSGGLNIQSDQQVAQTFTVGRRGQLVRVDVQARSATVDMPNGDLILDIRPTVGGIPVESDALVLASVSIPVAGVPPFVPLTNDFIAVDVSPFSIFVNPGEMLAISMSYGGPSNYVWLGQSEPLGALYAGGAGYSRRFTPTWGLLQPSTDFGFRTYVPEPPSLALVGVGLAALGLARRNAAARRGSQRPSSL